MFSTIVSIVFGILGLFGALSYFIDEKKPSYKNLDSRHVVVTGGSSGIGKAAAIEAAIQGAHVTIIGRDSKKLEDALGEICKNCKNPDTQIIRYSVLDVTSGYDGIEKCFSDIEKVAGPIFMLVNCAGACICGLFEEMKIEDIKQMIDLNYHGTALPTRWVLPKMRQRNEGIIVFVASEAAFMGIYGYSAYGAAKWAVRGLFEAVAMELVGTNVRVMLSYPPDTDTPGLKKENETKPVETKLISASGGLHSPDKIGSQLIIDAMCGRMYSIYSLSGQMLNILHGVSLENASQVVTQVIFMGILRALFVVVIASFHRIIRVQMEIKKRRN